MLNNVAYALMSPPMLEQSLVRTADALERAARLGDPVLHFFAANWRRQACAQAGDVAEMDRCTEIMDGLTRRLNQPMLTWVHIFGLAWLAIIRGDTEDAERFAGEALEIGTTSGQPDAAFIYGGQLMIIHQQRGQLDELRELMEEMAAGTPSVAGVLSGALAIAAMESNRPEDARRRLETFAASGFELEMNPVWITGMVFFADAAIELGDPTFAGPLFERLVPWADQWSDNGATAREPDLPLPRRPGGGPGPRRRGRRVLRSIREDVPGDRRAVLPRADRAPVGSHARRVAAGPRTATARSSCSNGRVRPPSPRAMQA